MKHKKIIRALTLVLALTLVCCVPAFAAGDVASAVESTWKDAAAQIKTVVDNVVFRATGDLPGGGGFLPAHGPALLCPPRADGRQGLPGGGGAVH